MSLEPSQAERLHKLWCAREAARIAAELRHYRAPHFLRPQALRLEEPPRNPDGTQHWGGLAWKERAA